MSIFETLAEMEGFKVPVLRIIILLSAVKIRVGRMFEVTGKKPLTKSGELISIA